MDDLHNFFYPYYAWDGDGAPYFAMSEKSAGATRREREATDKFDAIRQRLEHSLVNNAVRVIQLGANDNKSPWSMLPETTLQLCLQFFKPKGFDDYKYGSPILVSKRKLVVAEEASAAPAEEDKETTASLPSEEQRDVATGENATAASEKKESFDINALYTPGYKEMIPLLTPDHHLTGPCWRDFGRHVRSFPNWTVKRVKCPPEEKSAYDQYGSKAVYFVSLLYTVPGGKTGKNRRTKKKSKSTTATDPSGQLEDRKPPAKKMKTSGNA